MVFIEFLQLLGSFDFDTVLIQHQSPTRKHYDTAWTFNALYFTSAAFLIILFAPKVATFYETPELTNILDILAIGFVLTGLNNVKTIDFQKNFRFRYDFALMVSCKIASFATTVVFAFIFRNYWALLAGFIANRLTMLVMGYKLIPYMPRITFSETRYLFNFSSWLMLGNFIQFINSQSSRLIVGKQLGTTLLGVYTVGASTAFMFSQELSSTINKAAYPGYAKLSGNLADLRHAVLSIYSVIAAIAIPLSTGLYFVAHPLVIVILGEKWLPAVPIVEIVAFSGLILALQSNINYVFLALHKPRISTTISGIRAAILLPTLFIMTHYFGLIGAAFSGAIAGLAIIPINMCLLKKNINLAPHKLITVAWRPFVSAVAMAAILHFYPPLHHQSNNIWTALLSLLSSTIIGAAVYSTSLASIWILSGKPDGFERIAASWIKTKIKSRKY